MKLFISAAIALMGMTAAANTTTYTKGDSVYVVKSNSSAVTVFAGEPCGSGELYPCTGPANAPTAGGLNQPAQPCGNGQLMPCTGPANAPTAGGLHQPAEPCGSGELYPCTASASAHTATHTSKSHRRFHFFPVARFHASASTPVQPCGSGELYPCTGPMNAPTAGGLHQPAQPCGSGQLMPCTGPANAPTVGGLHQPAERCGSGQLYPCTSSQYMMEVDQTLVRAGYSKN